MSLFHVGILLDKSGSMAPIWKTTIGGLNEQISILKNNNVDELKITFITFNGKIDISCLGVALQNFGKLEWGDIVPKGNTSLYEGIGKVVECLENISLGDSRKLVYILSDGQDTSSKSVSREQAGELIKSKQSEGWTFVFLGCDQDLNKINKELNIPLGNIGKYEKTTKNTRFAIQKTGESLLRVIQSNDFGTSSFYSAGTEAITDFTIADQPKYKIDFNDKL